MRLAIGSDKSGFALKEAVKEHLITRGHAVEDLGLRDPSCFRAYYEVAPAVCRHLLEGGAEKGLLFCGTGMGMSITANKFKGIYAAVVESSYTARMCAVVNRANVLCMGGWVVAPQLAVDMVDRWLAASFGEGFPPERQEFLRNALDRVQAIESGGFEP